MLDKTKIHKCIIAITDHGEPLLLKSEPDLLEFDVFDGNDLRDNITHERDNIPKDFGVYSCDIIVEHFSCNNAFEIEYDTNTHLENIVKLNLK